MDPAAANAVAAGGLGNAEALVGDGQDDDLLLRHGRFWTGAGCEACRDSPVKHHL